MENLNQAFASIFSQSWIVIPFFVWLTFWKGWALWKAAHKRQLVWFMVLLLVNTVGLLEIVYIAYLHRWDIDKGKLLAFLEKKFQKS